MYTAREGILIDFLLNFEQTLGVIIQNYGAWVYLLIFLIIFAETAFVFMFFLPGDSLLITVGAFCATIEFMHLDQMMLLLSTAATLGYFCNYYTGRYFGERIYSYKSRFIKSDHLNRTHRFFERYGAVTILVARFVPFVRSVAPLAAGSSGMNQGIFALYNILGACLWIVSLTGIGYYSAHTVLGITQVL